MDLGVRVQLGDQVQQLGLRRRLRQRMLERGHANLDGLLRLIADIDLAGRIGADQHDRQSGGQVVRTGNAGDRARNTPPQGGREFLAIDSPCPCH